MACGKVPRTELRRDFFKMELPSTLGWTRSRIALMFGRQDIKLLAVGLTCSSLGWGCGFFVRVVKSCPFTRRGSGGGLGTRGLKPSSFCGGCGTTKVVPLFWRPYGSSEWLRERPFTELRMRFFKMERDSTFEMNPESICIDVRVSRELASCSGVNLVIAGFGGVVFSASCEALPFQSCQVSPQAVRKAAGGGPWSGGGSRPRRDRSFG